jgi:tetratricopeptide (TPR) repeat protein
MLHRRFLLVVIASLALVAGCSKDPNVAKREFVESGDTFMEQGKTSEAIIQYRNAVQQDPLYGIARLKLSRALRQSGDFTNAYREGVRAADILKTDASAQVEAGELLLLARQFPEAQDRADKALSIDPKMVPAQILRANALAGLNKPEDAIKDIEAAIRLQPDRSQTYTTLGAMEAFRGNRDRALDAFQKAVQMDPKSIDARLSLGYFQWVTGHPAEAEAALTGALQIDPASQATHRMLAFFYADQKRPKDTEIHLKALVESKEPNAPLWLADFYQGQKRYDDAQKVLEGIAGAGDARAAQAKIRLAGMGAGAGDIPGALKLVDEVLSKSPNDYDALTAKAMLLTQQQHLDEAFATAQAATKAEPKVADGHYILGRIELARGHRDAALAAFKDTVAANPRMAPAQLELARLSLASGDLDSAESFARAAIDSVHGYVEAHLVLTRIQLLRGDAAKAEPVVRALAKILPDRPDVQEEVGRLELAKKNYAAARVAFERALKVQPTQIDALAGAIAVDFEDHKIDAVKARLQQMVQQSPKSPAILMLAAHAYASMPDDTMVESLALRTLDADPNNGDAYSMISGLYIKQGRLNDALARVAEYAKKRPNSVGVHTTLGMLNEMQGHIPEAQAEYERALALDSQAAVAANNLAAIYMKTGGNLNMALTLAQTAKSRLPDDPRIDDTLGMAYYKKGNHDLAVAPIARAAKAVPKSATYQYHLGLANAALGRNADARAAFQKALVLDPHFADAADARQALAKLN